ncbi:MAG: thioredoxin family protein [Planctomycetota bacterium]
MNKFSTVIVGLSTVLPLVAQDQPVEAAAPAKDVWFADFDKAVEAAKEQKKDLLVDFTGSDWCVWCKRLDAEVFSHAEFLDGVKDKLVLVALDFPNSEEAKAKVPSPERNQQLQEKYGIQGFPTVLLMTPDGDVFGRTGYAEGGPEKYVASLDTMLTKGKARLAEVAGLQASLAKAGAGKEHDALVATAVTMLTDMTAEDPGVEKLAAVVKEAADSTDAGVSERAITALVKAGQADEDIKSKAVALDPENEKGIYELVVLARMQGVRDDTAAKAFLADLDKLVAAGIKNKETATGMLFNAMRWSQGPLKDKEGAKKWATALKKHVEGTPEADKFAKMIEMVLGS